jgi:hypothetical protein
MATTKVTVLSELTTPAVGDLLLVIDISEAMPADQAKKITTSNLGKALDVLSNLKNVSYAGTYANGDSGAAKTIDWATYGNFQSLRLTGDVSLSFTDPAGSCHLTLILIGDGTARTPDGDFDADAEWAANAEPDEYGSTDGEIVGVMNIVFDPDQTPKYVVSALAVGV